MLTADLGSPASVADALAALATLAGHDDVPVEVLVVPWGDGDRRVIEAIVDRDNHVNLADRALLPTRLGETCEGGNHARNAGAAEIGGTYVLFLDPLTRMGPGSLRLLRDTAAAQRDQRVVRAVGHRNPFDPASFLFRTADLVPASRSTISFDETHGDRPDATCAHVIATGTTQVEGQLWHRVGVAGRASGAMPCWSDRIEAWLTMVPEVRQLAREPEKAQWIRELVVNDLPGLLADAERLPYQLLPQLADVVGAVLAALRPGDLARVPVEARASAWLGGQARWGDLAELLARRAAHDGQFPTRIDGSRVVAELPGIDWGSAHPPEAMLEVGPEETRLLPSVRRLRWLEEPGGPVLAADVFALIGHLGLTDPVIQARWVGPGEPVRAEVRHRPDPHVAVVSGLRYQDQSSGSVTVLTPTATLAPGIWHLEVAVSQGRVVRTARVDATRDSAGSAGAPHASPDGSALPGWDDGGLCLSVATAGTYPAPTAPSPRVLSARTEDGWLALEVHGRLRDAPVLVAAGRELVGHVDGQTVRFDLRTGVHGLAETAAPCGRYRLLVGGRELAWDPGAEEATGFDLVGAQHRIRIRRTSRCGVLIDLRPPLRDEELGPHGQHRTLPAYDVRRPLADVVVLESQSGRACTGSPLALDHELARTYPALRRVWIVEDHSVPVPVGATSVLRHSREWHELLATARLLVLDGDLPAFFSRRTGQLVLQTLSGYPARTMGVDEWNARNLAPTRIEHLLARSAKQWSALTAPGPRVEHWFRESFRYDGELLSAGLPRTDLLLGPDAAERGRLTRQRLGIDPRRTVLFYAPEPGSHPVYAVRPREILDVDELAAALGSRCTVLLRDPSPGRRTRLEGGARVIDVSDHPEVSDLMLASDAALFDYSALRFDYALLGRPMIFQVPDPSVRRGDARGFLVPYAETAPGPVVVTATEVAALVADLGDLQRRQAPALARFNAEFNDLADGRVAARVLRELFGDRFRQPVRSPGVPDETEAALRPVVGG